MKKASAACACATSRSTCQRSKVTLQRESGMEDYTRRAVKVFRECSTVPVLSSAAVADLGAGRYEVLSKWNQRELERGKKVAFTRSFVLERNGWSVEKTATCKFTSDASSE